MSSPRGPVTSRSTLMSLLSEACELEHGLLCSYLFAAFSLKQELDEGGMTWQQQQKVRAWAAQIYAVAAEEMLHLAQAWNLLAAIGGTPYYHRPNFPQPAKYYRLRLPLELQPFGEPALTRFVLYELPTRIRPEDMARRLGLTPDRVPTSADLTIGELYDLVLSGLEGIPEDRLFVGSPARQVGEGLVDFPDIVCVSDRRSARAAVEMITSQGEGTSSNVDDCHFGMFLGVLEAYRAEVRANGPGFQPVRRVAQNPMARRRGDCDAGAVTPIADPLTREVAELFEDVYELMLRMLQYVFSNSTEPSELLRSFARVAIVVMPTVIKPLGEALTLLPIAPGSALRAGPAFGLTRHVPLPVDPEIARVLVRERLDELVRTAARLAGRPDSPTQLVNAAANLQRYATV